MNFGRTTTPFINIEDSSSSSDNEEETGQRQQQQLPKSFRARLSSNLDIKCSVCPYYYHHQSCPISFKLN